VAPSRDHDIRSLLHMLRGCSIELSLSASNPSATTDLRAETLKVIEAGNASRGSFAQHKVAEKVGRGNEHVPVNPLVGLLRLLPRVAIAHAVPFHTRRGGVHSADGSAVSCLVATERCVSTSQIQHAPATVEPACAYSPSQAMPGWRRTENNMIGDTEG